MKLIKQSIKYIPQGSGLDGIYKQIELGGKVCYQSSHTIKEDSAKRFVEDVLIKNGHGRPLEHGTVYLNIHWNNNIHTIFEDMFRFYNSNKYSKCIRGVLDTSAQSDLCPDLFITTNMRVIVENDRFDDLKYICEPTEYHAKRVTFNVVCDRQIQMEIKTHTTLSSTFESTRFCAYDKEKYSGELTFINHNKHIENGHIDYNSLENMNYGHIDNYIYLKHLLNSEATYLELRKEGWKPQYAAKILPNALKSEGYITGFVEDWQHFLLMRDASNAHPDIQELARSVKEQLVNNNYLN